MLKEGKCLAVSFLENSLSFPGVLLEEPKGHTESHMDTLDAMSSASEQELASELISFIKKDTHHFGKGKSNVGSDRPPVMIPLSELEVLGLGLAG